MSRYVTKPKSILITDDYGNDCFIPEPIVHDSEPKDTGLVDSTGREIMRMPEPLGFELNAANEKA